MVPVDTRPAWFEFLDEHLRARPNAADDQWIVSDGPGSRCSRTLRGTTTVDRAIGRCLVCETRLVLCLRDGPEMIERFLALVGGRCAP